MNNFRDDLAFSHSAEGLKIWNEIYDSAFPNYLSMNNQRENGQLQHAGIDRTIILNSGKAIYIDEKVRRVDYGDILLEYVSNDQKNTKGWAEKPLFCDYIAYAILPSGRCFLLPVPQLQKAWKENKDNWLKAYGTKKADNHFYNTLNCPIPTDVLLHSIHSCFEICFKPLKKESKKPIPSGFKDCPKCGQSNHAVSYFCYCGFQLREDADES
jgi:hypothetical protein